jgi:tetratricopeptide (TPR) repeat protein
MNQRLHRVRQLVTAVVLATVALVVAYSVNGYAQQQDSRIAKSKALVESWQGDVGKLESARSLLQEVLKVDPRSIEARILLARCELRFGFNIGDQYENAAIMRAQEWLDDAKNLAPGNGDIYVELANLDVIQGRLDRAADHLKKADELRADQANSLLVWGRLYQKMQRFDDAIAKFQGVLTVAGNNRFLATAAYEGLVACHVEKKNFDAAQAAYGRILQLNPTSAWVYGNYSKFLRIYLNDFDGAEANARRALEIMRYGDARQSLARSLYMKWGKALIVEKDQAKAKKLFDEAYALDPDPAGLLREAPFWPKIQPVVPALKQMGVSMDRGSEGAGGNPLLNGAISAHNLAYAAQLIALGARVDARGFRNSTPLMIAAVFGDASATSLLLQHGADPTLVDDAGKDAADYARRKGFEELAKGLEGAKRAYAPTPAQVAASLDPDVPFRAGWVYRVKKKIHTGGAYGSDFSEGAEMTFAEAGGYASDPNVVAFWFRDPKTKLLKDWAVNKTEINAWPQYFEELGPAAR